jgi:hypothetical protein
MKGQKTLLRKQLEMRPVGAGFSRHGRTESPPPHMMLEIFLRRWARP